MQKIDDRTFTLEDRAVLAWVSSAKALTAPFCLERRCCRIWFLPRPGDLERPGRPQQCGPTQHGAGLATYKVPAQGWRVEYVRPHKLAMNMQQANKKILHAVKRR
mmetsp:Transcript_5655/g.13963  ORF Transcript_5655/g.13963 Transcript_5655/m.13963 type:complete len:105 (-) Transcript_5655:104-418(-)